MKPQLRTIPHPAGASLTVKADDIPASNPWHYHPELEIALATRARGTRFVGDGIGRIDDGDVWLIGSNLPHTCQRDCDYYAVHPDERPDMTIVQFLPYFLGETLWETPEFAPIGELFGRALRGLRFTGETRTRAGRRLANLPTLAPTARALDLLALLDDLARSTEFDYLTRLDYQFHYPEADSLKINRVYEFTINHFRDEIRLDQVAPLANLTPSAFCRYFKSRTRRSYFEYLTEVRISYACKLLQEERSDVAQACYASGFNNLTHFHRQFKTLMGLTPGEYAKRKRVLK
ncbi:MAG: AraC family transcriptional regulator [Cytophagaceae bacterium]|nr:AraC family transcriptional regulator [Cytophagaceae bacterium]